jgi:hypothetical protein
MTHKKNELEWIEKQAEQNMAFHLANIDALNKEAHTTLSLLLVAIPAAFSCAVTWFQKSGAETWAFSMAVTCLYLIWIAYYVARTVTPRDIQAPGNRPTYLIQALDTVKDANASKSVEDKKDWPEDWALSSVIQGNLIDLEKRIEENHDREEDSAAAITRARSFFIATPLVFLFAVPLVFIFRLVLGSLCP